MITPGMEKIVCVNLVQPWAQMVMDGKLHAFSKTWNIEAMAGVGIYARKYWNWDWLKLGRDNGYQRVALGAVLGRVDVLECVPARHKDFIPPHERRIIDFGMKDYSRKQWYYWRVKVVEVYEAPQWVKVERHGLWVWNGRTWTDENWKATGKSYQMSLGI